MKALVWGFSVGAASLAVSLAAPAHAQYQAPGQYPAQANPTPSQQYPAQPYPAQQQPSQPAPGQQGYPSQQGGYAGGAEQTLAAADRGDTGRGLEWVWLNAEVGFQALSLQGLKGNDLVDGTLIDDSASGLSYGGAVGVRVIALTLGARFRYGNFSAWDLWSVDLEGGFHIPLGHLEPFVVVGAGYSRAGAYDTKTITANVSSKDLSIDGFNVRLGGGLDYYVTPRFSVGALVNVDLLALYRSKIAVPPSTSPVDAQYRGAASSLGWGVTTSLVLGLHF
jgi:hypothetical protein